VIDTSFRGFLILNPLEIPAMNYFARISDYSLLKRFKPLTFSKFMVK